ncbi:NAD(P)-dependent oxidoreductase [Deinococcus peraridilitoris]|uniref:NAD(P)-dependent oxidoreductase n=1 Tax=Deinococcus peraridilitoris TaxID=432329 RepID=UPI0012F7F2FC
MGLQANPAPSPLTGPNLGLVGYGHLGQATARKGQGLGWHAIAYDASAEPGSRGAGGVKMVTLSVAS